MDKHLQWIRFWSCVPTRSTKLKWRLSISTFWKGWLSLNDVDVTRFEFSSGVAVKRNHQQTIIKCCTCSQNRCQELPYAWKWLVRSNRKRNTIRARRERTVIYQESLKWWNWALRVFNDIHDYFGWLSVAEDSDMCTSQHGAYNPTVIFIDSFFISDNNNIHHNWWSRWFIWAYNACCNVQVKVCENVVLVSFIECGNERIKYTDCWLFKSLYCSLNMLFIIYG